MFFTSEISILNPLCSLYVIFTFLRKDNDQERQRGGEVVDEQRKLFDEEDGDSLRARLIGAST